VAYKRDIDDVRESPALDIIRLLEARGAEVSFNDPYVPSVRLEQGRIGQSVPLTAEWIKAADCVVIVTDHRTYDYGWLVANSRLIIDTRNATNGFRSNGARVVSL
jgi:UDP-N-acetyl-D-glucosamine dehydrogenase